MFITFHPHCHYSGPSICAHPRTNCVQLYVVRPDFPFPFPDGWPYKRGNTVLQKMSTTSDINCKNMTMLSFERDIADSEYPYF